MSAFITLKEFLKFDDRWVWHKHKAAILEWFLEKYGIQKEVLIYIGKDDKITINSTCIKIDDYIVFKRQFSGKIENILSHRVIMIHLGAASANYCRECRDNRRRFWEEPREIIQMLPMSIREFVINLPMYSWEWDGMHSYIAVHNKYIYREPERWLHNFAPIYAYDLLDIFLAEYRRFIGNGPAKWAAKWPNLLGNYRRFADVCVLCSRV